MTVARFITDPIVHPIGQMQLMPEGIAGMLDWVKSRAPACVPDELMSDDKSVTELYVRRNGIPVWCGNSITYHAKMSFFIAGVSRRVSHELIRNYVGADRTEEGAPSQQSTRYVENPGYYVIPPRYLERSAETERTRFEDACRENFDNYRDQILYDIEKHTGRTGAAPKGMDYKRILEAASGMLIHSVETSFIWTTNPAALTKLFKERDNEAADLEFQRFARKWKRLCMEHWPNAFPQPWMREGL